MTLSRFLRDCLYIPLGGSRHGRTRQVAALMITMTLGGLWHGASWSFMLWGALHGLLLVAHLAWTRSLPARWLAAHGGLAWRAASIAVTFHAVCLAWAFFRIADASAALACLRGVLVFDTQRALAGGSADLSLWLLIAAYGAGALALRHVLAAPSLEKLAAVAVPVGFRAGLLWGGSLGLGLLAWLLAPSAEVPPFIYFQF